MDDALFYMLLAVLLVPYLYVGRRWFTAFIAAHQRAPRWRDIISRDDDPETERWRLPRLVLGVVFLGLLIWTVSVTLA